MISKETRTAGGVVVNRNGEILIVNQNYDSWSLPKGHVDEGETELETAKREIYEESGISQLTLKKNFPPYVRYRIGLNGNDDETEIKNIQMFLFETPETELKPQDPINPEARWVKKEEVCNYLTHMKDRKFFESIMTELER